ncbi:hypothetical protein IFM89_039348, partial [Coptis chinensis]
MDSPTGEPPTRMEPGESSKSKVEILQAEMQNLFCNKEKQVIDIGCKNVEASEGGINEENVNKVGQSLGKVKAVDLLCSPEFNKPIELGETFPVTFKCEKFDIFCYFCGCIGHDLHYCYQREKYSMDMKKYGGSPRDVMNNFSFMLRANVFYNGAASLSPVSVTISGTPQKLRYDQIPTRSRGSPVKQNWTWTGILATPPRRRMHVEQPTNNRPVATDEGLRGLAESRTTLFERALSVAVVGIGLGGPNLDKTKHGSGTHILAQEVRDGHMGLTNMSGTNYGALVIWNPVSNGSDMDLDEGMGKEIGSMDLKKGL